MRKFFDYLLDLDEANLKWYYLVVLATLIGFTIVAAIGVFILFLVLVANYPVLRFTAAFLFGLVLSRAFILTWRDAHDD